MTIHKVVQLNTDAIMPAVGLGTWKAQPGDVERAVKHALEFGYRHIDTAQAYGNEKEVGAGIKASGIPRGEIFLTTKLDNPAHENVEKALFDSLNALDTPYLDLWLMHWPAPMKDGKADKTRDWIDTWKKMEELFQKYPDKLKAIGVSNFSVDYLERLLSSAAFVPAVNQVELHPSNPQHDVVEYCTNKGIAVTAYSPLGSDDSPLLKNDIVKRIAEKYKIPPANILISYAVNRPGVAVIPKSVTIERIESNFRVAPLTDEEMAELHKIDETHHFRAVTPEWTGWGHLGFPDRRQAVA